MYFRGLNDLSVNMLADSHPELNEIYARSVLIPPNNHLSITLTRDNSIDILSLLYPMNATTADFHKASLTDAERSTICKFKYSLSTAPDIPR